MSSRRRSPRCRLRGHHQCRWPPQSAGPRSCPGAAGTPSPPGGHAATPGPRCEAPARSDRTGFDFGHSARRQHGRGGKVRHVHHFDAARPAAPQTDRGVQRPVAGEDPSYPTTTCRSAVGGVVVLIDCGLVLGSGRAEVCWGTFADAEAELLAFCAFPAEHRPKLRSTNPLEHQPWDRPQLGRGQGSSLTTGLGSRPRRRTPRRARHLAAAPAGPHPLRLRPGRRHWRRRWR
jgi:hypothetical protein